VVYRYDFTQVNIRNSALNVIKYFTFSTVANHNRLPLIDGALTFRSLSGIASNLLQLKVILVLGEASEKYLSRCCLSETCPHFGD
jgi:hypothetical protein